MDWEWIVKEGHYTVEDTIVDGFPCTLKLTKKQVDLPKWKGKEDIIVKV